MSGIVVLDFFRAYSPIYSTLLAEVPEPGRRMSAGLSLNRDFVRIGGKSIENLGSGDF